MRRLFKGHEEALEAPWEIAQQCDLVLEKT